MTNTGPVGQLVHFRMDFTMTTPDHGKDFWRRFEHLVSGEIFISASYGQYQDGLASTY